LAGDYNFDSTFTSITTNSNSGLDLADLMLWLPTTTVVEHEDYTYREIINCAALFFQDEGQVAQGAPLECSGAVFDPGRKILFQVLCKLFDAHVQFREGGETV
jgi:hypothetical protein